MAALLDRFTADVQTELGKINTFFTDFKENVETAIRHQAEEDKLAKEMISAMREQCDDLLLRFDTDYQEFIRERKRWRSDFEQASQKANDNARQIEQLMHQITGQNQMVMESLKVVLDAEMIGHLIQKQDFFDKKHINLYGRKEDRNARFQTRGSDHHHEDLVE